MKKIFSLAILMIACFLIIASSVQPALGAGIADAFGNNLKSFAEKGAGYKTATDNTIFETIGLAVNFLIFGIGMIFFGLMVYAGTEWLQAMGNDEKVKKAQAILQNAIIGLVLTIGAYAVSFVVMKTFGEGLLS